MQNQLDDAHDIIKKLFERTTLTAWDKKKLYDLKLRYHLERAKNNCAKRDSTNGLNELRLLIKNYIDCPSDLRDSKMIEKLRRAIPVARDCRELLRFNHADEPDIITIIDWLNKTTGYIHNQIERSGNASKTVEGEEILYGVIDKLVHSYGFIRTDDNERFFFHYGSLDTTLYPESLYVGKKVRFVKGESNGKECATTVFSM
jgi:cold shock CspA family protein